MTVSLLGSIDVTRRIVFVAGIIYSNILVSFRRPPGDALLPSTLCSRIRSCAHADPPSSHRHPASSHRHPANPRSSEATRGRRTSEGDGRCPSATSEGCRTESTTGCWCRGRTPATKQARRVHGRRGTRASEAGPVPAGSERRARRRTCTEATERAWSRAVIRRVTTPSERVRRGGAEARG